MEDSKKTPADLLASLCLDPGFVLVPQDRYEELVRAETERDVIEAALDGRASYTVQDVMAAIRQARRMASGLVRPALTPQPTPEPEGKDDAQ